MPQALVRIGKYTRTHAATVWYTRTSWNDIGKATGDKPTASIALDAEQLKACPPNQEQDKNVPSHYFYPTKNWKSWPWQFGGKTNQGPENLPVTGGAEGGGLRTELKRLQMNSWHVGGGSELSPAVGILVPSSSAGPRTRNWGKGLREDKGQVPFSKKPGWEELYPGMRIGGSVWCWCHLVAICGTTHTSLKNHY